MICSKSAGATARKGFVADLLHFPVIYFKNYFFTAYLPMNSSGLFDNTGGKCAPATHLRHRLRATETDRRSVS